MLGLDDMFKRGHINLAERALVHDRVYAHSDVLLVVGEIVFQ